MKYNPIGGFSAPQSFWRSAYLNINALLPVVVVYFCLFEAHNVVAAIFAFHVVCLIALPVLLIVLAPRSDRTSQWYTTHIRQELFSENWREQLPRGLVGMALVASVGFVTFVGEQRTLHLISNKEQKENAQQNGLDDPQDASGGLWMLFLAAWFSLVNPVLEELFWRVYLRWELQDPFWGLGLEEGRPVDESAPPEVAKWAVSCYYASYHAVAQTHATHNTQKNKVVSRFLPWYYGLAAFIGLSATGRALVWMIEIYFKLVPGKFEEWWAWFS